MDKKSPLFQLMDLRMNGIMNDITAQDEAYQSLIKKADIYTGRLDSMNLPNETRLQHQSRHISDDSLTALWGTDPFPAAAQTVQ